MGGGLGGVVGWGGKRRKEKNTSELARRTDGADRRDESGEAEGKLTTENEKKRNRRRRRRRKGAAKGETTKIKRKREREK